MTEEKILDALTEIFRDVFDDPALVISADTTAEDIKGWDSVAHINIVVATEIRFNVKFKTSEIEELKNVGELVNLIQKRSSAS
jgi:acyl carrier protein